MICVCYFFLIILAVFRCGCLNTTAPQYDLSQNEKTFYYEYNEVMYMNIVLHNVPADANKYVLHFKKEDCSKDKMDSDGKLADRCKSEDHNNYFIEQLNNICFSCILSNVYETVLAMAIINTKQPNVKKGKIPKSREIYVKENLTEPSIIILLELFKNEELCSTKRIITGVRFERTTQAGHRGDITCLNRNEPCRNDVDFMDMCEELEINSCHYDPMFHKYSCGTLESKILPEDTIHQWYQECNDSYIGVIPPVVAKEIEFKMKLEKFDNNTYIFSKITSKYLERIDQKKIIVFGSNSYIEEYNITNITQYSEAKEVEFDCQEYLTSPYNPRILNKVQVCLIGSTGYNIKTFNVTKVQMKFNMADNGTQLCCLFYTIDGGYTKRTIERFVEKHTFLIYDESSILDENETSWLSASVHTRYYIIASVIGLTFLVLLIFIVSKKFYRKKSNLEESNNSNAVLYADLDLRSSESREPTCSEESPYVRIIGELRPPP